MTIAEEIQAYELRLRDTAEPAEQAPIIMRILNGYVTMRSTEGEPYLDRLLQIAELLDDAGYRGWVQNHRSIIARFKGDYSAALQLSVEALAYFTQVNELKGVHNAYNNMGLTHRQQGNYPEALRNFLEALKVREQIGDQDGVAMSYTNIGMIYYWQGNYTGALENNTRALQMMEATGNQRGIGNCLTNVAHAHYALNNHEEALAHHRRALEIEQEAGNGFGIAISRGNIGIVYRSIGNFDKALENLVMCYELSEHLGNKHYIASVLSEMGIVYYELGMDQEALEKYTRGLEISTEIGGKAEMKVCTEGLMKVYRRMGDYERALEYYERFYTIEKEITGEHAQREMAQLNIQHEVDLKDKEAQLLKEKNEAINIYAQKLEMSNNELKQFANVASHDLREPLRMVTSYMTLLEQTMGEGINPMHKQFIGFAVDGAKRMEQLILDLLRLAKVDANPQIESVSLTSIVSDVRSNLEILLKEKNAEIISDPLPTIMADRTQVMQLFQNIIGNGIKYNESPRPTITIRYEPRDKDILLSIADNGIGIPAEYRQKAFQIFQRLPTAKQYQGTGIGLAICKKIVDGLGGHISIDDADGCGTVFAIELPLSVICE